MANTDDNRRSLSPLHLATEAYPPTFLVAPQLDTLISPTQSFLMAQRLSELGVEAVAKRANYAIHAFDRKVRLVQTLNFAAAH
jgi:acetyl esterase/lipase